MKSFLLLALKAKMTMPRNNNNRMSIVKLVSWQKWYHLEELLNRNDGDYQDILPFDDRSPTNRLPEEHIIHLACQHQAPIHVIKALSKHFPSSISTPETKGRYPIHIACAKGLSPKIVDYLIKEHPHAAGTPDEYGKTPLHYVCESYAHNFRAIPGNIHRSPDRSVHVTVALLLDQDNVSPNIEDLYGMNALEYAIDSDADIRTVKSLQEASRNNWRSMRRKNRAMSHDDLRRSITSLSSSVASLNLSGENLDRIECTSGCTSTTTTQDNAQQESKLDDSSVKTVELPEPERKVQAARTA